MESESTDHTLKGERKTHPVSLTSGPTAMGLGTTNPSVVPPTDGPNDPEVPNDVEVKENEIDGDIIRRLPPSPHQKIYFQCRVGLESNREKGRDEPLGTFDPVCILIIDVVACAGQLYDRCGRQYGNRPDPGYQLRPSDVETIEAGGTIKVGSKILSVITAQPEEAFRSGEFFLRTEHHTRKREQRKKEREEAAQAVTRRPKISFGAGFAATQFRKRPREGATGFVVPVQGRIKGPNGLKLGFEGPKALHDHDAPNAVVLFRADYKRDAQNRPICSVVVDPIIGDKLRPHQRIGVQFLFDCVTGERMPGYYGAILADEMGLGKTIQTVATIWTCLKQGKFGTPVSQKCVVVAPSSLVKNWCNEFDKWLGEGKVKHFAIAESTPKGDRILSRFEGEGDVLVISYDQLRKYVDRLSKIKSIDLIVCDEGHRLKNAEIKTTKAVDMMPSKRRIILSGTPIQNDLSEFHAMVDFVNPGIVGPTDLFKRVFEEPIMHGRDPDTIDVEKELGQDRAHYLANLTQKFILRRTQTINEKYLPAKVDMTVFCGLGDHQRSAYEAISTVADQYSSAPLVLITSLKKLCSHMDLLYEAVTEDKAGHGLPRSIIPKTFKKGSLSPSSGSKMAFVGLMLDQLVAIQGTKDKEKLVIVSNYTQTLHLIAALCVSKKVQFFQLDGATPIKKRQELVDRFNIPMGQELVFLLSSKAGGVGLNLIGANRLILFDPDWNPANDAQAMGRVWRDGQKKKVFIYRLLSTGTIEEKIYQRQVSKQGLSANVVDMKDDSKQHFTAEELRALFTYKGSTLCDTHDLLGCRCLNPVETTGGKMQFRKVAPQSGPRMDELKSWQHVSKCSSFALDAMLARMCTIEPKLVTFLFANERDAQKLQETVKQERAFLDDEGGIVCPTQSGELEDSQLEVNVVNDDDDDSDS